MIEAISLWLHETAAGKFFLTMFISMAPVAELRVGVPAGVAMGLPIPLALLAGVMGNMVPVPFVILFIRNIFKWVRRNIPGLGACIDRIEARAYRKIERHRRLRYEAWGLLLLVAIPLPGTGAWTGSLVAALLNMRVKNAVPVILIGVVIAGLIVTALTYGVTAWL